MVRQKQYWTSFKPTDWVKGIQVCSNEGIRLSSMGNNIEIVEIYWGQLNLLQFQLKLYYAWLYRVTPFIMKIHVWIFEIFFTRFIIFKEIWTEALLSKVSYSKFWIYWVSVNTMTIEQWGFFSVFIWSWHSLVAGWLADKVSQPVLKMYVFCTQDSNTLPSACEANATNCLWLYS